MTDLMPEIARQERTEVEPECTAEKHGRSNHAWLKGCRCPGAVAAHERRKMQNRASNRRLPAQVDADGNCIAERHDSARAYRRGCRCPESVAKYEQQLQRERVGDPPWEYWRGAGTRVYRWNLFLAVHGFCAEPLNRGELMAAVHILLATPNRYGTGLNTITDVATILDVHRADVWKATEEIRRRRARRDRRRLADVKLREYRRTLAIARGREHDLSGHKPHRVTCAPNPGGEK